MLKHLTPFPTILLLIFFNSTYSQPANERASYLMAFDSVVKIENTLLYNGNIYKDRYRSYEDNHRYFASPGFLNGSVYYDGQQFDGLKLKLDLSKTALVVKLKGDRSYLNLELITEQIDSFTLKTYRFINIDKLSSLNNPDLVSGFVEVLFSNKQLALYSYRHKTPVEQIEGRRIVYHFPEQITYLLRHNDNLYKVKDRGDLKKLFPEFKKQINSYFKQNPKSLTSNSRTFNIGLVKLISNSLYTTP